MFLFKNKKSKTGLRVQTRHESEDERGELRHEVREMFIGHHTIFSLIGLTIGGTLIARTLWQWLSQSVGLPLTLLIGLFMFAMSGLVHHSFVDNRYGRPQKPSQDA